MANVPGEPPAEQPPEPSGGAVAYRDLEDAGGTLRVWYRTSPLEVDHLTGTRLVPQQMVTDGPDPVWDQQNVLLPTQRAAFLKALETPTRDGEWRILHVTYLENGEPFLWWLRRIREGHGVSVWLINELEPHPGWWYFMQTADAREFQHLVPPLGPAHFHSEAAALVSWEACEYSRLTEKYIRAIAQEEARAEIERERQNYGAAPPASPVTHASSRGYREDWDKVADATIGLRERQPPMRWKDIYARYPSIPPRTLERWHKIRKESGG